MQTATTCSKPSQEIRPMVTLARLGLALSRRLSSWPKAWYSNLTRRLSEADRAREHWRSSGYLGDRGQCGRSLCRPINLSDSGKRLLYKMHEQPASSAHPIT